MLQEKQPTASDFSSITAAIWLAPATMLLIALAPLPYGYYTLLRFAVCAAAAFLAWKHYAAASRIGAWSVGLGLMAVLFNPLIPIHLNRSAWAPIDIGAAIVFVVHYYAVRSRR